MLAAERRHLVLREVGVRQVVTVIGLAHSLRVSPMTIRRDLDALASEGKLTRVHGGAMPAPLVTERQASFEANAVYRAREKDRIGAAAAALVNDGETILLDVGTTTLQLARHVRDRRITLITSNLAAFDELRTAEGVELILIGGVYDRHYRSLGGFLSEDMLRQVRADRLFLSASAVRGSDLSVLDDTAVDVRFKRRMIAAASQVILMVDAEKFRQSRPALLCGADEIDVLVTDSSAPVDVLDKFEVAGVRVIRA